MRWWIYVISSSHKCSRYGLIYVWEQKEWMATYVPAREFSNSATGQRPVFPSLLSKRSFWERFHVTGDWQHPPGKRGCYSCPWLDRARSKGGNITCSCYLYSIVSLVVTIHPLAVACLLVSCYFLYVSLTNYLWKSVTQKF